MTGEAYDPRLERYDVAIRAAAKLTQGGRRQYASKVGLRPEHFESVNKALLEIDDIRTEDGLMELVHRCPFLLRAAVELLRLYAETYAPSRSYHYGAHYDQPWIQVR